MLFDKKPVCITEYHKESDFFRSPFHLLSLAIWGAKSLLNHPYFTEGRIRLHLDENEGLLLIINQQLFLKTVNDNLPLFQYVLGPTVTPEALLDAILSSESFFSVMNYDRVLIGIVLGFGTQNSLFHSRLEVLECHEVDMPDKPPFLPKSTLCRDENAKEMLLFFSANKPEHWVKEQQLKPSLGFHSLKLEKEYLLNKIRLPSDQLIFRQPRIVFGSLKDQAENKTFIHELELTQNKINQLLQSSHFLKEVLHLMNDREEISIEDESTAAFPSHTVDIHLAAAKLLKRELQECEPENRLFYIEGLTQQQPMEQGKQLLAFPEAIKNVKVARLNLAKAALFFEGLRKDHNSIAVLEHYLHYTIVTTGSGRALDTETKVCIDFEIFDPNGKCLNLGRKKIIDLEQTISGFAHGVKGMKVGETREISIHPALAYGVHTLLEKGIYLRATVHLINILNAHGKLPPLLPQDLSFIASDHFQHECEEGHKRALQHRGVSHSALLKRCGLNPTTVTQALTTLPDHTLTPDEREALNNALWSHYFCIASHKDFF